MIFSFFSFIEIRENILIFKKIYLRIFIYKLILMFTIKKQDKYLVIAKF